MDDKKGGAHGAAGIDMKGTLTVTATYVFWGVLTIFWDLLGSVNSVYVLAQRIVWSMILMAAYITVFGKWKEIREIFLNRRKLLVCFAGGILITVNWGVFIYAVSSGNVLDSSLGYFIEPILAALLGMLIFRERLSRMEKITVCFSVLGVLYLMIVKRTFPILAFLIGGSFAVYGAVKKPLDITPHASLFMETLCMTPLALAFVIYADTHGFGSAGVLKGTEFLLLPISGVVTSVPLLLFNIGVQKIPYYLSGILMYINPTLQFLTGLLYFHEEMDMQRFLAFGIIWLGILFMVYEKIQMIKNSGNRPRA